MSDIYCGTKKVPKNKRRGSMLECSKNSQIRYWGINKVDSKILNMVKTKTISFNKALLNKIKFDTRLKKLTKDLEYEKDKDKKLLIQKNIETTKKEIEKASNDFKNAYKIEQEKKALKNKKK